MRFARFVLFRFVSFHFISLNYCVVVDYGTLLNPFHRLPLVLEVNLILDTPPESTCFAENELHNEI